MQRSRLPRFIMWFCRRHKIIFGPVLCNIFTSDIDSGMECTLSKSVDVTNKTGAVDTLKGQDAV